MENIKKGQNGTSRQGINDILDTGEEKISKLEDRAVELSKMKHGKIRLGKKTLNRASVSCGMILSSLIVM